MIPGLLHGRLLGGGVPSGIIASPSYPTTLAFAVGYYDAEVEGIFTIRPNGTWDTVEPWYTDESGVWYLPTTAGIGSSFEVRMTPTRLPVNEQGVTDVPGILTNDAANWVPLSSARSIKLKVSRYTQGRSIADYNVLIEIRPAGGGAVASSGVMRLRSQVQVDSSGGGGGGGGGPSPWDPPFTPPIPL